MHLPGLGVDQVGRERPRVAQEERVGQGAVVPGEPQQVQADDEQHQRVEQPFPRVDAERGLDQGAVGQRERQVAGDQRGGQVLAVGVHPPGDDPDRLDARGAEPAEVEQELVLALREGLLDLLDREHRTVDAHEPHGVPRDAARHRHGVLGGPLLQGDAPGQEQQVRLRRCGRGAQRHGGSSVGGRRLVSTAGVRRFRGRRGGCGGGWLRGRAWLPRAGIWRPSVRTTTCWVPPPGSLTSV